MKQREDEMSANKYLSGKGNNKIHPESAQIHWNLLLTDQ